MKTNPVVWFEIYVQDMPRARAFYEKVLGVQLSELKAPNEDEPSLQMWAFPGGDSLPGASGALAKMEGVPSGGGTMVYFACEDCAVEAARLEPARGKLMKPKFPIGPYGFIAIGFDPDGNCIGLHSMK